MVAQTVPTSARYSDKSTTVGTCSASRENGATGAPDCSARFHDSVDGTSQRGNPQTAAVRRERFEGFLTINV